MRGELPILFGHFCFSVGVPHWVHQNQVYFPEYIYIYIFAILLSIDAQQFVIFQSFGPDDSVRCHATLAWPTPLVRLWPCVAAPLTSPWECGTTIRPPDSRTKLVFRARWHSSTRTSNRRRSGQHSSLKRNTQRSEHAYFPLADGQARVRDTRPNKLTQSHVIHLLNKRKNISTHASGRVEVKMRSVLISIDISTPNFSSAIGETHESSWRLR